MAIGTQRRIRECIVAHSNIGVAAEGASVPVNLTNPKKFCLPTSIKYSSNREYEWVGGGKEWEELQSSSDATMDMEVFAVPHDILTQYFGYPDYPENVGGIASGGYADPVILNSPYVAIGYVDQTNSTEDTDVNALASIKISYEVKVVLCARGVVQDQTSTSKPNTEKADVNGIPIHFTVYPVFDATKGLAIYRRVFDHKSAGKKTPLTEVEAQHMLYTIFGVEREIHVDVGDGVDHVYNLRLGRPYNIDDIIAGLQDPSGQNRPIAQVVNALTREVIDRGVRVVPVIGPSIAPAIAEFLGNIAGQFIGDRLQIVWGQAPENAQENAQNNQNNNDNNEINNNDDNENNLINNNDEL